MLGFTISWGFDVAFSVSSRVLFTASCFVWTGRDSEGSFGDTVGEGTTEGEDGGAEGVAIAGGFEVSCGGTTAGGLGAAGDGTTAGRLEGAGGVTRVGGCVPPVFKRWRSVIGSKIVIAKIDAKTIKKTDAMIMMVRYGRLFFCTGFIFLGDGRTGGACSASSFSISATR